MSLYALHRTRCCCIYCLPANTHIHSIESTPHIRCSDSPHRSIASNLRHVVNSKKCTLCARAHGCAGVRACVRARVRACVRACVRVCVRAGVRARVRARVRACGRACVRACARACVRACVRAYVRMRVRASQRAFMHLYVRMCRVVGMPACVHGEGHGCVFFHMAAMLTISRMNYASLHAYTASMHASNTRLPLCK